VFAVYNEWPGKIALTTLQRSSRRAASRVASYREGTGSTSEEMEEDGVTDNQSEAEGGMH
jgi:hypothetical protein